MNSERDEESNQQRVCIYLILNLYETIKLTLW